MKVPKVCSPITMNYTAPSNNKNPNFKAKLSLSKNARETLLEQAHVFGLIANGGKVDKAVTPFVKQHASYIHAHLDYLDRIVAPLEPIEYPIVFDVSKEFKKIIENGDEKRRVKFEIDALRAPNTAKPLFELCPEGKHLGSDYSMAFNINFSLMHEQMDRLYYAIKERMDIILGRNY